MELPVKQTWRLLSLYLRPQRKQASLLALLVLGGIGLQLANPQIVRRFIDTAQGGGSLGQLTGAAGIYLAIALVRQLLLLGATYLGENIAWRATNELRAGLTLHCLSLDLAFHKKHQPGELIERVDGDVNELANFFSLLFVQLTSNLLLLLGVLALLWLLDWRVGLAISGVALLGASTLQRLNRLIVPRWQAVRQAAADLFGSLEEWLNGMEDIHSNAAGPFVLNRLHSLSRQRWLAMNRAMRLNTLVITLPIISVSLAYAAAYILGDRLFHGSALTIGSIYLIFQYIEILRGPLWEILRQVEELQRASASINRIAGLLEERSTITDGAGVPLPAGPLSVQFEDVSFRYDDEPGKPVLQQIDLTLPAGTVLGLLGKTGSGKTTLIQLLFRFYDPTQGRILLGGQEIGQAQRRDLRRHVGLVTQQVELFHASVRDNLTLFEPTVPDAKVEQALREVELGSWLDSLPAGLDTWLDGHSGLSAGQAQLLALARVFLVDPGLVILDEASSRLDPATEKQIERALARLLANRTGIVVAHRLATVEKVDCVAILAEGRLVEQGPRNRLAADPTSHFYALLRHGAEESLV